MSRGNKRGIDAAKLRDWRQAGIALAAARPVSSINPLYYKE